MTDFLPLNGEISSIERLCDRTVLDFTCKDVKCNKSIGTIIKCSINIPAAEIEKDSSPCYSYFITTKYTDWLLLIYPNGTSEEYKDCVSICLTNLSYNEYEIPALLTFDFGNENFLYHNFKLSNEVCQFNRLRDNKSCGAIKTTLILMYLHDVCSHATDYRIKLVYNNAILDCDHYELASFKPPRFSYILGQGFNWIYQNQGEVILTRPKLRMDHFYVGKSPLQVQRIEKMIKANTLSEIIDFLILDESEDIVKPRHVVKPLYEFMQCVDWHTNNESDQLFSTFFRIKTKFILAFDENMVLLKRRIVEIISKDFKMFALSRNWFYILNNRSDIVLYLTMQLSEHVTLKKRITNVITNYSSLMHHNPTITIVPVFSCVKTSIYTYSDGDNYVGSTTYIKAVVDCHGVTGALLHSVQFLCSHYFQTEGAEWKLVVIKLIGQKYIAVCLHATSISCSIDTSIDAVFTYDCDSNRFYSHTFSNENPVAGVFMWPPLDNGRINISFILRCVNNMSQDKLDNNHLISFRQFDNEKISNIVLKKSEVVKLIGNDWTYYACKQILIENSPVFRAMFSHDTLESRENLVKIPNISSKAMKEILSFMYSGRMTIKRSYLLEIFMFSDMYDIKLLRIVSEHELCFHINEDSTLDYLLLATQFDLNILRWYCIFEIGNNFNKYVLQDQWKCLSTQPDLMRKLFHDLLLHYDFEHKNDHLSSQR